MNSFLLFSVSVHGRSCCANPCLIKSHLSVHACTGSDIPCIIHVKQWMADGAFLGNKLYDNILLDYLIGGRTRSIVFGGSSCISV